LRTNVSGKTTFALPADAAVLIVIAPAGGAITYDLEKMLIDGVIVDYRSSHAVTNYPPRIKSLAAKKSTLLISETTTIYCTATDRNDNELFYRCKATDGTIIGSGAQIGWTAPDSAGSYMVRCFVDDGAARRIRLRCNSKSLSRSITHQTFPRSQPVPERLI
jgi:hypothetical protein